MTSTTEAVRQLRLEVEAMMQQMRVNESARQTFENKVNENLNKFPTLQPHRVYKDIVTDITSGDNIQLDSYKCIPEFSGNKTQYRSWREQVVLRMKMIEGFKTHPKYEAALGIIRSKITNTASDILINNKTAYNIDAIIERLDFSYADQRPLYVVKAEMTSIKQANKTLQEYFDKINQALNMVITKIVMTYKSEAKQKSLVAEMQQEAIRTFIMGLKSSMIRNILYGHTPRTLSDAFAIAQTVFYDNQYLQLDQHRERFTPQNQQPFATFPRDNPNQPKFQKPEPMEQDDSKRYRQSTNWRQPYGIKREYNDTAQFRQDQPPEKQQKLNLIPQPEEEADFTAEELMSETETASAFLGE